MAQRLPPLSTLRPFEAAARLGSFSRAAEEIHLTHGAVSHQVRALEEFLGASLFVREGRRVILTEAGRRFAESVRAALTQLADAAQAVHREESSNRLTITSVPSFASRWLLPRLGRFVEAHPELQVGIDATMVVRDFARDDVHLGIRFGAGVWPGVHAEKMMEDVYFPVVGPRFRGGRLPREPAELAGLPLLRSEREPWTPWFRAAGLKLPEPTSGPEYSDSSILLQAAALGQGIALARASIARADVAAGVLVRLFEVTVPATEAYWLVTPPGPLSPKVATFREWLLAERDAQPTALPPPVRIRDNRPVKTPRRRT